MNKNKTGIKKQKVVNYQDGRTKLNLLTKPNNWSKMFVNGSKLIVADMQLVNGDYELHVVEVEKDMFTLFGKRYIVNSEYLIYNRTLKMHTCKYHENISLPIKQYINPNSIKEAVEKHAKEKGIEVIENIDPIILDALVKTTIIQKVFNGAEMQDLFGLLKLLSIIILLISGVSLVILIGTSGIF